MNSSPENVREIRSIGEFKKRINCVFESLGFSLGNLVQYFDSFNQFNFVNR